MIIRIAAFVGVLGFATLSHSQSPKVTYQTVAVPVSRALAELSKASGVSLSASPAVARDVVTIDVKGVSLEDLKTQIAKACSAKWEDSQGGLLLVPDLVQRREEERKEHAEYTAQLAKSLKGLVDSLTPPKPEKGETEARQQMAMFGNGGSAGKAIIRIAQAIGPSALASIGEKQRVVFSSNPTRMQRALPAATSQILRQLVGEYNEELIKRQRARSENPVAETEAMKKMREFFGEFEEKPVEGTPTKAILVCTRQSMVGALTMNLKVFNETGKVVISGQQMLASGGGFMGMATDIEFGPDGLPREKPAKPGAANEKPIEFSPITKELMTHSNVMTMAVNQAKFSPELKSRLLQPNLYDPLSFSHSEALLAVAAQRGKSLVACLPDEMISFIQMMGPGKDGTTPTAYMESIDGSVTVGENGSIMLIRPKTAAKSRRERFNRDALGKFIRAAESKGAVMLDDLAEYAQHSNNPMEEGAAMMYFMFFAPNAVQSGMGGMVSWDMLRFYGGLSVNQKRSMSQGSTLSFGQLNPIQRTAVNQMVFGPDTSLFVDDPNAKKPEFELPTFVRGMMGGRFGADYRTEPTELMPNGLPSNGYVELKLTEDYVAKPTGAVSPIIGNAMLGADELALFRLFKEMPGMEQFNSMMPNIDEVRMGERSVYDFKFHFAPNVRMEKSLNDDRISANSPTVRMSNIPSEFSKKIDERLAAFKKMPFFDPSIIGGGRSGGPPPPAN